MKVYKINLENDYKDYYATGNSFDHAEERLISEMERLKKESSKCIFGNDGSLKPEFAGGEESKPIIVKKIELLTDNII